MSSDPIHSLNYSIFYFRFFLFTLGIIYLINNNQDFVKHSTFFFTVTLFILLIDGYIQYFFGRNLIGIPYNGYRVSSFFNDELVMGTYLARLMPFCFALIALRNSSSLLSMAVLLIGLVLTDILIFLSGERTAFFLLFLATTIIIIFIDRYKILRLVSFIISIIAIVLISFNAPNVKERMVDRTLSQMAIDQKDSHVFSTQHEGYYDVAINLFSDNPFFGKGPGMFRELCPAIASIDSCSTHPHNNYIQLLAETGIIGTLPLIILFMLVIYIFFKQGISILFNHSNKYLSDARVCLYAALLLSLWPLMPTMSFFNNWINIIYYIPVAFILAEHKVFKKIS